MRVALLQRAAIAEPLAMLLGASAAFRGHEVEVFLPRVERDLFRALRRFAPAVVLIAEPTGGGPWALEQARAVRGSLGGAPVLLCGPWAAEFADRLAPDVDGVLIGDPETSLTEILGKIQAERELPGTSGTVTWNDGLRRGPERAFVDDPDQLPLPDLEIYRRYPFLLRHTTLATVAGRGALENLHRDAAIGPQERRRCFRPAPRHSPAELIRRLHLHLQRRPSIRRVAFRDDTLPGVVDDGWLGEVLSGYQREIRRPFSCVARPDRLDAATVSALAGAGCRRVLVAVDGATPGERERACGVPVPDDAISAAFAHLRESGIAAWARVFWSVHEPADDPALLPLLSGADQVLAGLELLPDGSMPGPEWAASVLALPLARSEGAWRRLRRLPLPALRRLHSAHHDVALLASGELTGLAVAGTAWGMSAGRSPRASRPVLE